uniref:Uncharacterized protein n=1 Tax=viral metagenome TaxID=1070528 RepID=A0A6C0ET25_9ZZZZ
MGSGLTHELQDIKDTVTINGVILPVNGTLYKIRTESEYDSDYDSKDSSGFRCKCTCVFCSRYENLIPYEIELALPCFKCIEKLKNKTYNTKYAEGLYRDIRELGIDVLIGTKMGWMTESDGIAYAKSKNISLIEFKNSFNILKKYGIFLSHKK